MSKILAVRKAKKQRGIPFRKDNKETGEKDPRINRKGRPLKTPDALETEIQNILAEIVMGDDGKPVVDEINNEPLTRLRARLRIATSSRNSREFWDLLAHAYGKPKQRIDVTSGGEKIVLNVIYQDKKQDGT